MANDEDYFIPLLGTADSIRVRRTTERGQTLAFTVQYEPWVDGIHRPAVRYDTAHGFAHRDLLDWNGAAVKDRDWAGEGLPFDQAFGLALDDIRATWEHERAAFLRRKP